MNTIIRPFRFALFVLLGAGGVTAALAIFAACAHATVVADGSPPMLVTPAVAAEQGLPVAAWLMIALSALVSLERIVRGLAQLSGIIAKRTTNTFDDAVHDKLDRVADVLDEVVAVMRGAQPVPPPLPAEPNVHTRETSPGTLETIKETP